MTEYCGGCQPADCRPQCRDSFASHGIVKVHWECWTACNLPCSFCYRTKQKPLSSDDAITLLRLVRSSGAKWITFAGGDPSIRPGVVELIRFAKDLGLKVEVQTNAQETTPEFRKALFELTDQVGLSIDGADAHTHDTFRSCPGNFDKVTQLLSELDRARVPVVVRTVVAKGTRDAAPAIADLLKPIQVVKRWSLLEFTPLNEGARNRTAYEISSEEFQTTVHAANEVAAGEITVDGFGNAIKGGTYALVSPSGELYGTVLDAANVQHRFIGNMLTKHLSDLVTSLPFDSNRHQVRYGET